MKPAYQRLLTIACCTLAAIVSFCPVAFASDEVTSGRKIYDSIMLLINFGIIAFLFLKYGRKPLMAYLRGVRKKIAEVHNEIEDKHNKARSELNEQKAKLDKIEQYIEQMREQIVAIGRKEKDQIIDQAKISAEKMIANAVLYADYQMAKAKKELSDQIIDIAVSMVEERIQKKISQADNDLLVDMFLENLETTKQPLG